MFAAGQPLVASDLNLQDVSNADATLRTTTSTAYTSTLTAPNICGVAFTAPPSGKVKIHFDVDSANSGNNFTGTSPEVRQGSTVGSGTVFQAAADSTSVSTGSTTFESQGRMTLVTGLTPGTVYNVALCHRVVAGTGSFDRREVTVAPSLA